QAVRDVDQLQPEVGVELNGVPLLNQRLHIAEDGLALKLQLLLNDRQRDVVALFLQKADQVRVHGRECTEAGVQSASAGWACRRRAGAKPFRGTITGARLIAML